MKTSDSWLDISGVTHMESTWSGLDLSDFLTVFQLLSDWVLFLKVQKT